MRVNQRTLTRLHDQFKEYLKNNNTCPSELLIGLGTIYMKFWESHYQFANALFNYTQPQKKPLPEWAQQDVDAVFITIIQTMAPIKENLSEKQKYILTTYKKFRKSNLHKMISIPIFKKK